VSIRAELANPAATSKSRQSLFASSIATSEGAQKAIDRIHGKLEESNDADNLEDFHVALSIGAAEWRDGQSQDEVLDGADQKMFEPAARLVPYSMLAGLTWSKIGTAFCAAYDPPRCAPDARY